MTRQYRPPYRITPAILHSIEQIGEALGKLREGSGSRAVPVLGRGNRIKTVHGSLAIEGNSLSLEQVTAVLAGKRVLASPREIQEVRNAFAAYEKLSEWSPHSRADLLAAHGLLMAGLVDEPGRFRSGKVGIERGGTVIRIAPPATRVPALTDNLLAWLEKTDEHPLVAGCIFHYELEFIHPFEDGNGRMGRLWQTLILTRWRPIFALLPVESIVRDLQQEYYEALGRADQAADAKAFVEFMLAAIQRAIEESAMAIDREETLQKTPGKTPYRTDASGLMVQFNTGIQRKEKVTKKTPKKITALLKADGSLSISALAEQIGISASTVGRALRKLRQTGVVERVGPDKGGHWVVKER